MDWENDSHRKLSEQQKQNQKKPKKMTRISQRKRIIQTTIKNKSLHVLQSGTLYWLVPCVGDFENVTNAQLVLKNAA